VPNDKTSSLKWAIDELSKQRKELENQLSIAQKRDETSELITEVHAQKEALQKRISALEDGLQASSDLVQTPVSNLESNISEIDDKLEIAKERLENLEQEEYFEELGRKLNGKQPTVSDPLPEEEITAIDALADSAPSANPISPSSELSTPSLPNSDIHSQDFSDSSPSISSTSAVMKPTTSRIQQTEPVNPADESSRLSEQDTSLSSQPNTVTSKTLLSVPVANLQETAENLGVEQEFLVEKSVQAVLRMIARNGGKLSFPLEVEQS
jgi:gas vesicle protein